MKTGQELYREELLIAAGVASALSATFFYRQKKTIPFKLAYFLSWPLLGTAILTAVSPDQEKMRQKLEKDITRTDRITTAEQIQELKSIATKNN